MNTYPQSEYPNLYQEILKDYYYRFPKFHPIPYIQESLNYHHEQQRNSEITGTSNQSVRTN